MRERLIELLRSNNAAPEKTCPRFGTGENCEGCKYLTDDIGCDYIARTADYLLANGVIVPPCKVGDTVYIHQIDGHNEDGSPIFRIDKGRVFKIQIDSTKENTLWLGVEFGLLWCCRPYTDFYFTREEAEAALLKGGAE